jgi:transaldolase
MHSSHEVLRELCQICPGTVFYQLTARTVAGRKSEGEQILQLQEKWWEEAPAQTAVAGVTDPVSPVIGTLGLKIPASTENMALVSEFARLGVDVAVTAMFSLSQAYVACEAGATYLLPYANRFTRLRGDGVSFVRQLAEICRATDRGTRVLAASIKSPHEAVQVLIAGACHVSMPLSVLLAMGHDPLSVQAVAEFDQAAASA